MLHPVLTEFQELIDTDPVVRMYVNQMIAQVPTTKPYRKRHLESVTHMMRLIDEVLTMAPEFGGHMVATPLGAILDWTMGTPVGFAAYRDPRVNAMIKKILSTWCEFLNSGDSLYVLNDSPSGWKCAEARAAVGIEQYEHDPKDEHWGFASWNDFFTRRFAGGERPVASPEDDKVIVSACESTPYGISTDVKRQDRFWIKSQPYSLADMLANDDSVEPMNSQSYLAHVAARAVILIEADDPVIGLMAFVAVGMSEVSSCLIGSEVTPGYHVLKGEELGYFQYGGSTHCLVFRPGAIAEFALAAIPQPHDPKAPLMLVRSKLAIASTAV